MAEIRVEPKRRSMGWVWVVLVVLVVAAVAYFIMNGGLPDGTASGAGAATEVSLRLTSAFPG